MKPIVIETKKIYDGKVFSVRVDWVKLENGHVAQRDVVEHSGGVSILPIDDDGNFWFVKQYRHPIECELLELPAGTLETGETPMACAQREIREEIGMKAGNLQKIGACFLAPGYSSEFMHIFLAQNLSPAPLPGDEDEIIHIEKIPVNRVYEMAHAGLILDAKTLAILLLASPFVENRLNESLPK